MTNRVCLTVDVEDWYDGMAVLGARLEPPPNASSGLGGLGALLGGAGGRARVTLFSVGEYAGRVRDELTALAAGGHEIASHGPDHGRLPHRADDLLDWLRRGREGLEDLVQVPVRGFRSPRFDIPAELGLARFRDLVAEAGFEYVSDTSLLGDASPVRELPVLTSGRVPIGGGSYQRLFPVAVTAAALRAADDPAVLYYHSYDFGATLPSLRAARSVAVAKQVVGRGRVAKVFSRILGRYGSEACGRVRG